MATLSNCMTYISSCLTFIKCVSASFSSGQTKERTNLERYSQEQ